MGLEIPYIHHIPFGICHLLGPWALIVINNFIGAAASHNIK